MTRLLLGALYIVVGLWVFTGLFLAAALAQVHSLGQRLTKAHAAIDAAAADLAAMRAELAAIQADPQPHPQPTPTGDDALIATWADIVDRLRDSPDPGATATPQ